jgi:hypothetical protein
VQVDFPHVTRESRDGLPVLWSPVAGPAMASLIFRAGFADETLATRGVTHLVEHLALFPLGRRAYEYNGRVEDAYTLFWARGTEDEVLGFLREVTASLAALPLDRLETEKRILLTEAAGRPMSDVESRLLALRFGPHGYGLATESELGLTWLGGDAVARWARERFTRGNAALWLSFAPPAELDLALPPGDRFPPPPAEPIPGLALPATIESGTGGVVLGGVGARSPELTVGLGAAVERTRESLRRDAGLSYDAWGSYLALDADAAHVSLGADCRDPEAPVVRDGLLRALHAIGEEGPTAAELELLEDLFLRGFLEPDRGLAWLDHQAREALLGGEPMEPAELAERRRAVTAQGAAEALRPVLDSLLVIVPVGTPARNGDRPYASGVEEEVRGKRYSPTPRWSEWGERTTVVVGDAGVTLAGADGDAVTVHYDDCLAAIPSLGRTLTLRDRHGTALSLQPGVYSGGHQMLRDVIERVRDVFVEQGDRARARADRRHQPRPPGDRRPAARARRAAHAARARRGPGAARGGDARRAVRAARRHAGARAPRVHVPAGDRRRGGAALGS